MSSLVPIPTVTSGDDVACGGGLTINGPIEVTGTVTAVFDADQWAELCGKFEGLAEAVATALAELALNDITINVEQIPQSVDYCYNECDITMCYAKTMTGEPQPLGWWGDNGWNPGPLPAGATKGNCASRPTEKRCVAVANYNSETKCWELVDGPACLVFRWSKTGAIQPVRWESAIGVLGTVAALDITAGVLVDCSMVGDRPVSFKAPCPVAAPADGVFAAGEWHQVHVAVAAGCPAVDVTITKPVADGEPVVEVITIPPGMSRTFCAPLCGEALPYTIETGPIPADHSFDVQAEKVGEFPCESETP